MCSYSILTIKIMLCVCLMACIEATSVYTKPLNKVKSHAKLVYQVKEKLKNDILKINNFAGKMTKAEKKDSHVSMRCTACTMWVNYELWKSRSYSQDSDHSEIQYWLEAGCEYFKVEAPEVCQGSIRIFGPEVVEVLARITLSAEEICGISMPDICPIHSINDSGLSTWEVSLPLMTSLKQHHTTDDDKETHSTIKVLHISDVHIDTEYQIGGNANCDEPVCCRTIPKRHVTIINPFDGKTIKRKAHGTFRPAGTWGDYHSCDLPIWTLEDLFQKLSSQKKGNTQKFDYVIWTGDVPAHDVWAQSRTKLVELTSRLTKMFLNHFPGVPVYPSVGNHDSFPSNNFPPRGLEVGEQYSVTWLYEALAVAWSPWLPKEELKNVRRGGFYTALVKPGYRIVSLNTNLCYTLNWWVWLKPQDPGDMLAWFVDVLTKAEQEGEKVQVIGHVPPGRQPECFKIWSANYNKIITRFRRTITAQFFGHTHYDEVQVFYADNKPVSVAYLGPSVTPYVAVKPAYRVYDMDGYYPNSTWSVLNHQTYTLDLNTANKLNKTDWRLEYDALKDYGLRDLSVKSWADLLESWIEYLENVENQNVPKTLQKYARYYVHGYTTSSTEFIPGQLICNTRDCLKIIVCDIGKEINFPVCAVEVSNQNNSPAPTNGDRISHQNQTHGDGIVC